MMFLLICWTLCFSIGHVTTAFHTAVFPAYNYHRVMTMLTNGTPFPTTQFPQNRSYSWWQESALDGYEYRDGKSLAYPIYSFVGASDPDMDVQSLERWAVESSSSKSRSIMYPGGSFFLLDPEIEVRFMYRPNRLLLVSWTKNKFVGFFFMYVRFEFFF